MLIFGAISEHDNCCITKSNNNVICHLWSTFILRTTLQIWSNVWHCKRIDSYVTYKSSDQKNNNMIQRNPIELQKRIFFVFDLIPLFLWFQWNYSNKVPDISFNIVYVFIDFLSLYAKYWRNFPVVKILLFKRYNSYFAELGSFMVD